MLRALAHTFAQTLKSRERLSAVTLLDTDVDVVGGGSNVGAIAERVPFVSKGIWRESTRRRQLFPSVQSKRGSLGQIDVDVARGSTPLKDRGGSHRKN